MTTFMSPSFKFGLRLLGVLPGVPYSTVYWLIFMSNMLIMQYFQYLYVYNHFKMSELSNLVDSLPATIDYTLTVFKMTILFLRRRVLHQLLTAMNNDWRDSNMSHFCYNAMLGFNILAGVLYYMGDIAIQTNSVTDDYNKTLLIPIRVQLPLKFEQSPLFELIIVYVFLHFLFFVYVFHVSGQIEIICQEFNNISKNISLNGSSAHILGLPIYRHNKVISFSCNIEKLVSFIALMQVGWNILVMCTLGFVIVISINNEAGVMALIKPIFAYVAVTIEPFITCFAGEYLSFKSTSIADAAYESLWYNMPLKQSKVITIIIMRAHRQLAITAGKMMDMSFETFSNIIKTSASYISVLHAMY
ncbi:Odorant receptor 263 [Nylanderia fulva]|uniref:Odorant receptor n=1 Tax=Nylanderia fulva TaxID=613905 RepID=A0A6G1LPP7_9HYME|nr:Odorant receptor 263 [Nylanderia fulva]